MSTFENFFLTVIVFGLVAFLFRLLLWVIWKAKWTPENNPKWGEFGRSLCKVALLVFILNLGLRLLGFPPYWFWGVFPLPHLVGILVLISVFYIYGEILGGLK